MKRLLIVGLIVATAAVGYATVGERIRVDDLFSRFRSSQRLPSRRDDETPFRYPVRLWREGVEGEVLLRIHISLEGLVDSVEIERSSGHALLDSLAMSGARELSYRPARRDDQPISVWALLPVRFSRSANTKE